jgi:hypothetical protein
VDGAGVARRADAAAQPPFESLRERRETALLSPSVRPTPGSLRAYRRANSRGHTGQVSHVWRLPSADEFDPSPHARRMCNLCGMTRTCSICRSVSSVNSTPLASPQKFGVSRSPLSSGLRDRELPRATLSGTYSPSARGHAVLAHARDDDPCPSCVPRNCGLRCAPTRTEWELMSTLADDTQRASAGSDGRKARSRSIRLSRGSTVSSRMRDAYVDQETFRGRYGKMLAQYSSMQSLVHELQRERLQLSHSHDTPTEPVGAGLQRMEVFLHTSFSRLGSCSPNLPLL